MGFLAMIIAGTAALCFAFVAAIFGIALRPFQKFRLASSGLLGMAAVALALGVIVFWQYA
jgi:hypothetical protein